MLVQVTHSIKSQPAFARNGEISTRGYEIRPHWSTQHLLFNLAFSRCTSRDYNAQPLDTTGDSARIGASVGDRLLAGIEWRIRHNMAARYTLEAVRKLEDVPNGHPVKPAYGVHGIRLQWHPQGKENLALTIAVDNLLDEKYAMHSTVRTYYAGQEVANWESGRNVKLGLDWKIQ